MLNKIFSVSAYVIVIVILGLLIRYFANNPLASKPQLSGAPLYSANLIDTAGKKAQLEQYRGKIVVLNFGQPGAHLAVKKCQNSPHYTHNTKTKT